MRSAWLSLSQTTRAALTGIAAAPFAWGLIWLYLAFGGALAGG